MWNSQLYSNKGGLIDMDNNINTYLTVSDNGKWAVYDLITKEPLTDFVFDNRLTQDFENPNRPLIGTIDGYKK